MTNKTIAILGGAGFLGSAIATKLDAAGYQVKIITRRRDNAKHLFLLPNVQVIECDIHDSQALKAVLNGFEMAINCVGILHEGKHSFESVHHQLPRKLAQVCDVLSIKRLIHISALQAHKNAPSQYLRSKAAGEAALEEFSKKLNITVFQPSVIFGRDDSFLNMFASLINYLPIIALAKPEAKFQPIWVEDVAQAVLNSLKNSSTHHKTYALGGPQIYTLRQLVQMVMAQLGKTRPIIGLNDALSMAQAFMLELLPVKLMTRDNIKSMQVDNVLSQPMAAELNFTPSPLQAIMPDYLGSQTPRDAYEEFRAAAGRAINARR